MVWPGSGCSKTLGLSFLISKLRTLGYLIPKGIESNIPGVESQLYYLITQKLDDPRRPVPTTEFAIELHVVTVCFGFLISAMHPQLFIKSLLGAGHCARGSQQSLSCSSCQHPVRMSLFSIRLLLVPLPSSFCLKSSAAACLTCPILCNMSKEWSPGLGPLARRDQVLREGKVSRQKKILGLFSASYYPVSLQMSKPLPFSNFLAIPGDPLCEGPMPSSSVNEGWIPHYIFLEGGKQDLEVPVPSLEKEI